MRHHFSNKSIQVDQVSISKVSLRLNLVPSDCLYIARCCTVVISSSSTSEDRPMTCSPRFPPSTTVVPSPLSMPPFMATFWYAGYEWKSDIRYWLWSWGLGKDAIAKDYMRHEANPKFLHHKTCFSNSMRLNQKFLKDCAKTIHAEFQEMQYRKAVLLADNNKIMSLH